MKNITTNNSAKKRENKNKQLLSYYIECLKMIQLQQNDHLFAVTYTDRWSMIICTYFVLTLYIIIFQ